MGGDNVTKELARLTELSTKQTVLLENQERFIQDHEKRIRAIERVIAYGLGALGFLKIGWDLLHR